MVRIRPKNTELINRLTMLRKAYFTLADLEKVLGLRHESLYVTLNRLVKEGILVRLKKNTYQVFTASLDIEKMANELYHPSYLSFETALSWYGILSQVPYTITLATLRPSKKMIIKDTTVEFRHLKKELFFGYGLTNGKYIAEREKALLDSLYLMSRGKGTLHIEELDLRDFDKAKFFMYANRFPSYIAPLMAKVKNYLGTTPIGLETTERVTWDRK